MLASGSKGNAIWVDADGRAVLIDCGLAGREIRRRMILAGLEPARLSAVIVSHEHRDHVSGVGILARSLQIPIYFNEPTFECAKGLVGPVDPRIFKTGKTFKVGGLVIHPFSTSHDAADPVGFAFEHGGRRLGLATDLGVGTALVKNHLQDCHALILEANHDPEMLWNGPYPWPTKQRVKSRHGHLSNEESAELLAAVIHAELKQVVLAHISQTNNEPSLALDCVSRVIRSRPECTLQAAAQDQPGPVIEV